MGSVLQLSTKKELFDESSMRLLRIICSVLKILSDLCFVHQIQYRSMSLRLLLKFLKSEHRANTQLNPFADQFSAEFKEGKEESAEQMQQLQECIKVVAEKIREQEKELEAQKIVQAEAKSAEAETKSADETKVGSETAEAKTVETVPPVEAPTNGQAESTETEPAKVASEWMEHVVTQSIFLSKSLYTIMLV